MPPITRRKVKEIKQSPRKEIKNPQTPKKGMKNDGLEKQELGKMFQRRRLRKHEGKKQGLEKETLESQKLEIAEPEIKRSKRIELRKARLEKDQVILKKQAGTQKMQIQVLQKQETQNDRLQNHKTQRSGSKKEHLVKHESEKNILPVVVLSKLDLHSKVQTIPELKSQKTTLRNQKGKEELPILALQENRSPQKKKPLKLKHTEQKQNSTKLNTLDKENHNLDIYEFTFDPNEEPPPPKKKKRNRIVKKKPMKQKSVFFNKFYESNLSKTLNYLKSVIKKPCQTPISKVDNNQNKIATSNNSLKETPKNTVQTENVIKVQQNITQNASNNVKFGNNTPIQPTYNRDATERTIPKPSDTSIRVEDIAADFEPIINDDIDDSPINSPNYVEDHSNHVDPTVRVHTPERSDIQSKDPLNLQDDISFINSHPVANSSMVRSTRDPLASPWRVEFQNLPIKWHVNSYVKPDMTPAIESSFVNFEENNKKHVYTNLVPQTDEELPQIVRNSTPQLKQKSIISFIKEVIEKSAKKKRGRSVSPTKVNTYFDESYNIVNNHYENTVHKTPNKAFTSGRQVHHDLETPDKDSNKESAPLGTEKQLNDYSKLSRKHKTITESNTKMTQKEKDDTYFGFNDNENEEQENFSPIKNVNAEKVRALRPRSRAVLKEINAGTGPTRAMLPVAVKSKFIPSSEAVNKLYEDMKSAADAPVFPEKETEMLNVESTTVDNPSLQQDINDDDSQSVHLFEDIEFIHHLKPHRKSYGKPKKVGFQRQINFDSDTQDSDIVDGQPESEEMSDEDNLEDLTFKVPKERPKRVTKKKETKKQKLTKKEEEEANAWAAGFNSMCEDIDQFSLVVE